MALTASADGWCKVPNWPLIHIKELNRTSAIGVYYALLHRRNNESNIVYGCTYDDIMQAVGKSRQTVATGLKTLERLGLIVIDRRPDGNRYEIVMDPPSDAEVIQMPVLGGDPDDDGTTPRARSKRERVLGGTDTPEPQRAPRPMRDTPGALATYFQQEVIDRYQLSTMHMRRGPLMGQFKRMMNEEGMSPDQIRRMIRQFADGLAGGPPPKSAWRLFVFQRDDLVRRAAPRTTSSRTDYSKYQLDERFAKMMDKDHDDHAG